MLSKADYHRYLVEVNPASSAERNQHATASLDAYKRAYTIALEHLDPADPMRLGLALNFSVYFYDVSESPTRAAFLAKHAFDEALASIRNADESLSGPSLADAIGILRLLRDNLLLWTVAPNEEQNVVTKAS
jgi:14-3-3 protein epsilon